jgi:hypothetical protein
MAQMDTSRDPFALSRKALDNWERLANELVGMVTSTPEFSKNLNMTAAQTLSLKALIVQAMGQFMSAVNLPTRSDVLELREQLHSIEGRLEELSELARRNASPGADVVPVPLKRPARTRLPDKKAASTTAPVRSSSTQQKRRGT